MGPKSSIRIFTGSKVINFDAFLSRREFEQWHDHFIEKLAVRTDPKRHGDLSGWLDHLNNLPNKKPANIELNNDAIQIGQPSDLTTQQQSQLHQALFALKPWRKGPFQFFNTFIDTEWRSDYKWQRLTPHLKSLEGRHVLDVGCGTGYHGWRMLGAGAKYVLGIDPSMRFLVQFLCAQHYIQHQNFDFLPIGIEDMPRDMSLFDTVFSMGVLYHRRKAINHLYELKDLLKTDGELVLETLIMDNIEGGLFTPNDRYAQMRNVWSIMTVDAILAILNEAGFKDARCVDQSVTSLEEQRSTQWMQFHSLKEFLDPNDISKTIEGYPAPKRGVFIARR